MTKSTKSKLKSIVCITALMAASIHAINKIVFSLATMRNRLNAAMGNYYKWRFGNVFYKKQGSGKPLLLIHDLHPTSSAYEWNRTIKYLSENHTVYTLDLIGCGRSEKPIFTYTNYLYVQLISDFIKHVIGHKTDIVVTGLSSSFIVMACNSNPELFDRIILINPTSLSSMNKIPDKSSKTLKFLLESPIFGTLLYNLYTSRYKVKEMFCKKYFTNKRAYSSKHIAAYHEAAHLGGANAKFLYASLKGHFININMAHALKRINHSITIISGMNLENAAEVMNEYAELNPSIEKSIIPNAKFLPQLENPAALVTQLKIYLQ